MNYCTLRSWFVGIIIFSFLQGNVNAQSMNYVAGGAIFGGEFIEMPELIRTTDSVNARSTWTGDYKHLIKHFTYGFAIYKKRQAFEFGGSFLWGNTDETYVDGHYPSDPPDLIYTWRIRQRMINLNLRAGLALGNRFSIGVEAGGVLSNFQHLKTKSGDAALWFIKFSGTRSLVGLGTAYFAIRFPSDGLMFEVQPYYSWGLGKISFKDVFDPELYSPSNDLPNSSGFKCLGIRLFIGICKEQ